MPDLDILKKELTYKEEECGKFKQKYLSVDFIYSALGRKAIENYLKLGHKRIGIYAAGVLGRCLFDCIKSIDASISIEVIDQNGESDYFGGRKIHLPVDKLTLDAIIVTAPSAAFGRIRDNLIATGYENIVSLEDVLFAREADGAGAPQKAGGQAKKMVYLFDSSYKGIPGIRKKSLMQTKAFCGFGYESYLISTVRSAIEIYNYNTASYEFIGFNDTVEYYKIILDFVKKLNPDIIYVRKQHLLNMFVMDFYKATREALPETKMVLEVPTFPYDGELKGTPDEKYIETDTHYREFLCDYFDLSTNFNDFDEVFGIKSLKMLNGIDIDTIKIKEQGGKPCKRINLATATSMCYWNGLERLLAGIRDYYADDHSTDGYKVYFHIAGEGPDLGYYKSLAAEYSIGEYVIFYGELNGEALDEFYDSADFGVLALGWYKTNVDFAGGIRMAEFCAKGLPVIYAGQLMPLYGALPHTLEFPNDDSIIDIKKIVSHYEKLQTMPEHSEELRQYAENNFDWKIYIKRLLAAIGEGGK